MFRRFAASTATSRLLRTVALGATATVSIATFAGSNQWEVHRQLSNQSVTTLDATTPAFTDVFNVTGSGAGSSYVGFDGAVELRTNTSLAQPVEVHVRFIPTGAAAPSDEQVLYVGSQTAFTAVDSQTWCQSGMSCSVEGTFEVEITDPASLGGGSLDLHWVVTASLVGRGASTPANAVLKLTQP